MRVKQYSQIEPKSLYERSQIQQELTRLRQIAYPSSGLLIQQPPKPQPIYNWKLPPTHVPYDYERQMFWEEVKWANMFDYPTQAPEISDDAFIEEFFNNPGTNATHYKLFMQYRTYRVSNQRKHLAWPHF